MITIKKMGAKCPYKNCYVGDLECFGCEDNIEFSPFYLRVACIFFDITEMETKKMFDQKTAIKNMENFMNEASLPGCAAEIKKRMRDILEKMHQLGLKYNNLDNEYGQLKGQLEKPQKILRLRCHPKTEVENETENAKKTICIRSEY